MLFEMRNPGVVYCHLVAEIMNKLSLDLVVHYLNIILTHTTGMEEHLNIVKKAHLEVRTQLKPLKTLFKGKS